MYNMVNMIPSWNMLVKLAQLIEGIGFSMSDFEINKKYLLNTMLSRPCFQLHYFV